MQELILFVVGLIVGSMNAIAGGGMLIGFPVLLAAGLPAIAANATGSIVVFPGALSASYGYRKYLKKLNRRYFLLVIPCIAGAAIGAALLRHTSSAKFEQLVPVLVFFAVLLFACQPFLHAHLQRHIHSKHQGLKPLLLICLALFPVAIYGSYFAAGFGFIMLAFLGFTRLNEIHIMSGLKNLGGLCISGTLILSLYGAHLIHWEYGLTMAAGSLLGGYYGSRVMQKIPAKTLRMAVTAIGLSTATYLAIRTY